MRFSKDLVIKRAMVIYAHPDDAEFSVAGTVAKWAKAGVEVTYCMVTNGASGSQDPDITREELRDTRYAEQREAAKILGVKNVVFLGYEDGYLYPTLEVRRDVARQVRIHRPDVILAMDPQFRVAAEAGYVNHPDHIAAGEVALRTINPDASTRQMFPELWRDEKLEPHKPKALFLETFGDGGTVVDISDTMATKIKALLVHRSQLGPDAEGWVRDWNSRTGKAAGYKFGESFRVILLERPPDVAKKPARSRSSAAASKAGAGAKRSVPRTSRPRAAGARAAKRSGGRARRSR